MIAPDEVEVKKILSPYQEDLRSVTLRAWQDWWKSPGKNMYTHPRTRACIVWERIIHHARKTFAGNPNVHIFEKHGTFFFLFAGTVLLKFKKGDGNGLSSNISTQASLAFHDHDQDMLGLPDVKRVEAVYTLNKLETAVSATMIVGRKASEVLWKYAIIDIGDAENVVDIGTQKTATPPSHLVKVREIVQQTDKHKKD